jgi:ornithine carbamoyltransferase
MRHFLTVADLSTAEIQRIFSITEDLKAKFQDGIREPLLPGRVAALLFQHPSLRTRVSFEAGMAHLGGSCMFLGADVGFGSRESVADFARALGQFVDVVIVRAKRHAELEELARYSPRPVINGLTDYAHPCQAMADLYTLRELLGTLAGHTLAFVGDGNNVARSLAMGCGRLGMRFILAAPPAYQFSQAYLDRLKAEVPGLQLEQTTDPREAVRQADAVYTDVWASMGQESESAERRKVFGPYQVNARLMACAPPEAYFMHDLPAHRGEEVTDDVIDGPRSVVWQQAGNRMHVQKGILVWLLTSQA